MDCMEGPIKIDLSNVNHLNLNYIFKIDFKCYFVLFKVRPTRKTRFAKNGMKSRETKAIKDVINISANRSGKI